MLSLMIACLLLASPATQPTVGPPATRPGDAAVIDLRQRLVWRNRPLHPEVLRPMMPSFKSGTPEVLRVSVAEAAAQAESRPPAAPDPHRHAWTLARRLGERGTTRYRLDGHLADGRPVVSVAVNDGGTRSLLGVMVLRVEELTVAPDEPTAVALTLDRLLPLPGLDANVEVGSDFVTVTRPARPGFMPAVGVEAYERRHHLQPSAEAAEARPTGFTRHDLAPPPDGMPGELVGRTVLDLGERSVPLKVSVTSKGNGWLTGPGLRTKVYDAHDDGRVFEPAMHLIAFRDMNGDGLEDVVIAGRAGEPSGALQSIFEVWDYVPASATFSRVLRHEHADVVDSTPTPVPTLEQLDIYNVADLDHDRLLREQIVRDDYRVIGVAGFALSLPGIPIEDSLRVRRDAANYIVLRGTTDAGESPEHFAAIVRARAFAHQYNAALWDYLGPMPAEVGEAEDDVVAVRVGLLVSDEEFQIGPSNLPNGFKYAFSERDDTLTILNAQERKVACVHWESSGDVGAYRLNISGPAQITLVPRHDAEDLGVVRLASGVVIYRPKRLTLPTTPDAVTLTVKGD